jgi:putative membrane protein
VWARGRALRNVLDREGRRRVYSADNWWALAGFLWLSTGVLRAFAGFEKGTSYYIQNYLFHAKMGLLLVILVLEIGPIVALMHWRKADRRSLTVDTSRASTLARVSVIQAFLVIAMVVLAAGMARGIGAF